MSGAHHDCAVGPQIADGIQDFVWSPTASVLVVRCWEVQRQQDKQSHAVAKAQIAHDGPSSAFSADGSTVFSSSCDKAKMWALSVPTQGQQIDESRHPTKLTR